MTFGDRLAEARALRQLTQWALSDRSKVSQSIISHFESSLRLPSYTNLLKLADALSVSVDYLMGRTDNPAVHGAVDPVLYDLVRLSARDRTLATAFVRLLTVIEEQDAAVSQDLERLED